MKRQRFEHPAGSMLGSLERVNSALTDEVARQRKEAAEAAYLGRAKEITADRKAKAAKLYGELRQLTGDAGERLPEAYRTKRRAELLRGLDQINAAAAAAFTTWRQPVEQKARARVLEGSPMTSRDLQEVTLAVARYRDRTDMEKRHLSADAAEALRVGAHAKAKILGRAAAELGVLGGDVAHALDALDPEKVRGRAELEAIEGVGLRLGETILAERVEAGVASSEESIRLKVARQAMKVAGE